MTVDEFLVWDAPSGQYWQLIDGEPIAMAPTTNDHGAIRAELSRLVGNHIASSGSRYRVINQPGVIPRAGANNNFRIPDVGVACPFDQSPGDADEPRSLIEILSPSNEAETRANVWAYTTIPSVQEILLVRASRMEAELLRRGDGDEWPRTASILRAGDALTLRSIGFSVPLPALYRTTGLPR